MGRKPTASAMQIYLQMAEGDGFRIWRTPCSEKKPLRGAFELAHVLTAGSCHAAGRSRFAAHSSRRMEAT